LEEDRPNYGRGSRGVSGMKKILVVNDFPIYPPNHGGKIRIYNIYKHLSRFYHVTYVCYGDSDKVEENILSDNFIEIRVPKGFVHRNAIKALSKWLGAGSDDVVAMLLCKFNGKLISILKKYIPECDIVVSSLPYMFPAIRENLDGKRLIYEAQNVEYALKRSIYRDGPIKNLLCRALKTVEGDLTAISEMVFVPSSLDIDQIMQIYGIPGTKLYLSPNGTDLSMFDTICRDRFSMKEKLVDGPLALFMGSGHPPNIEAARNIIDKIAPSLRDVYFTIGGSVGLGIRNTDLPKNVGLTFGISDDEKLELFRGADVALNPMMSGSGTNIKMLDYMAAGLPIITTPVGARGLDVENYRDALICSISEFPEKIIEVLGNRELYNKLSRNGRKLVEEKYDWNIIAHNMKRMLE
jgi:glycosyltransferase involved in cell wall biosynthesis